MVSLASAHVGSPSATQVHTCNPMAYVGDSSGARMVSQLHKLLIQKLPKLPINYEFKSCLARDAHESFLNPALCKGGVQAAALIQLHEDMLVGMPAWPT